MDRPGREEATRRDAAMAAAPVPLALAALFAAYALAFALSGAHLADALSSAAVNVAAAAISGIAATVVIRIVRRSALALRWMLAIHVVGAVAFAFLWYLLVLVGFSIGANWLRGGLVARAFGENALVWQLFQGVTLYALLVLWCERTHYPATGDAKPPAGVLTPADPRAPLLVRRGDEIIAIELADIVQISAASGYAEIVTATRSFLSGRTLSSLAETLPGDFLRVHRSHIVRHGAIVRAEPAGNGRLTLHLSDGDAVTTSREGARLIRALSS